MVFTFVAGNVCVARAAADADVAEQLERHHDGGPGGVVDPASERQVGQHERGVEVPDAAPEERLADEQQQTDGVVVDQQQRRFQTSTLAPAPLRMLLLLLLLIVLYFHSNLQAVNKAHV